MGNSFLNDLTNDIFSLALELLINDIFSLKKKIYIYCVVNPRVIYSKYYDGMLQIDSSMLTISNSRNSANA